MVQLKGTGALEEWLRACTACRGPEFSSQFNIWSNNPTSRHHQKNVSKNTDKFMDQKFRVVWLIVAQHSLQQLQQSA